MERTLIVLLMMTACMVGRSQEVLRTDSVMTNETVALDSLTAEEQARIDSLAAAEVLTADSIEMAFLDMNEALHNTPKQPRKRFVPDSQRALWLGLIFPGGGQIYNRKYWKLPIFYGGFLGCVYALNWNGQMYSDYRQAYLDIMDTDPNTASYMDMLPIGYDITGKEERFKDIFRRKKDYYRHYRDMSLFAMVGVWALSVIDAYVDAELSTFDISPDLTLQVAPGMFPTHDMARNRAVTNTGVTIGLRF